MAVDNNIISGYRYILVNFPPTNLCVRDGSYLMYHVLWVELEIIIMAIPQHNLSYIY